MNLAASEPSVRPLQVRVSDLGPGGFVLFAGRGIRSLDQPGIREKATDGGKAADVVNLVEPGHGQDATYTRDAW